ncbi:MAG: DUF1178 family protein [Deltaproteobacteria bacterium]|nr:DUF1178 family protein [Deltaproteobacteria bacterium]
MIHFQLKCSHGHEFEAWFRSSASFADQCKRGDVDCPVCGDVRITKALMAPNISTKEKSSGEAAELRAREVAEQILNAASKLREVVEENCEYVGDNFADEARAIHYGDAEERDIYGETTNKEAEDLDEEGIKFSRLPNLNRPRRND